MKLIPSVNIYANNSRIKDAGLGVFARKAIAEGSLIEACPIVLIDATEMPDIRKTRLHDYYFMWDDNEENHRAAICLGFGSLYNHSYSPNATYRKLRDKGRIEFVAIKDIDAGEEITVNYNYGDPKDKSKLWIESIPSPDESAQSLDQ